MAAEAAESRRALRAVSLLLVLVACKAATLLLSAQSVPVSAWTPLAYVWQDALVVLLFWFLDRAILPAVCAWLLYALIALYAAINVPIAIVLSSPLTVTLLRATGGALSDSITHYVSARNAIGLCVPLVAAVVLPLTLGRSTMAVRRWWIAVLAAIAALGPFASTRVDTGGLHRNAIGALVASAMPRIGPVEATADWRATPFEPGPVDDLSRLKGIAKGRNVIVVILESTASRYLRPYGSTADPMPGLTALAREAVMFDRAYAVYPESVKGLFTTLCSRYTAFDTAPELYSGAACTSIASTLRSSGYRTALFHSGRFDYLGMRSIIDNRGFDALEDAGAIGGNVRSSFGVDEASAVRHILRWIDARDRAVPFFTLYLPIAGHHPYPSNTPGPFIGSTDFLRYLNALHDGDAALSSLVDGLKERRIYDDTLLVVFGDHGEAFGQHPGNFAHTLFIYEENVRVPFLILVPGAVTSPIRARGLASLVDVAPTILDLLALPPIATHQGTSLLEPRSKMALFYTDYSLGWLGLADSCWKYLYEIDSGRSRLFDVCADPDETRDRAASFPDRVAAYREHLRRWAAAQKAAAELKIR